MLPIPPFEIDAGANIGIYPIEMVWVDRQTALVLLASRADDTEAQLTLARLLPHAPVGRAPRS
jgi:hypothetical protein